MEHPGAAKDAGGRPLGRTQDAVPLSLSVRVCARVCGAHRMHAYSTYSEGEEEEEAQRPFAFFGVYDGHGGEKVTVPPVAQRPFASLLTPAVPLSLSTNQASEWVGQHFDKIFGDKITQSGDQTSAGSHSTTRLPTQSRTGTQITSAALFVYRTHAQRCSPRRCGRRSSRSRTSGWASPTRRRSAPVPHTQHTHTSHTRAGGAHATLTIRANRYHRSGCGGEGQRHHRGQRRRHRSSRRRRRFVTSFLFYFFKFHN